ncbi:MAG: TRAP transporter small permease [Deltaproteobacteria bacterium]|nr:TRAP transporter small permease [Deltaproteobacteria bacterium]
MSPEGNKQESGATLLKLSDRLNAGSERVLFGLMVAMIFFTTLQVISRVFFTALSWSEELTCFLLVFASLVGAAIAFKRGTHIAVTMIAQNLPKGGQKALAIGVHILGIVFFAVVAIYGALLMKAEAHQTSPALQIPMIWVYTIFPLFGGVIILHLIVGIGQALKRS